MYEKCFYFLLNSSFSRKLVFLRKLKPIYPSTSQHYNSCSAPTFLILFKKLLAPPPFKKEGRNCILYQRLQRRDNKVITILYDMFYLQNCKDIIFEQNYKVVWKMTYLISQVTFLFLTQIYYNMNFITLSSILPQDFLGTFRLIFADCFWRTFLWNTKNAYLRIYLQNLS